MDVSKYLGKVIGLYEIFISLAMITNMHRFAEGIQSLINNGSLMLYIGCVTVIMGLLMVVSHNIWQWSWRVLITIVAWVVLLKGVSILLFPHILEDLTAQFVTNTNMAYTVAGIDLFFGILLCYFGFRRE